MCTSWERRAVGNREEWGLGWGGDLGVDARQCVAGTREDTDLPAIGRHKNRVRECPANSDLRAPVQSSQG